MKNYPHPFVSTLKNGPCSSCGKSRSDQIHYYKEAGHVVGPNGQAVAAGVICKCPANFCPMHGRNKDN